MARSPTLVFLLLVLVCGALCLPRSSDRVHANPRIPTTFDHPTYLKSPWENEVCTSTYCTETSDYPSDYVHSLLRRTDIKFNSIMEETPIPVDDGDVGTDANKKKKPDDTSFKYDPTDGEPLCNSKEEIISPKKALSKDSQWMFILQDTKTGQFVQSVRIETCSPSVTDKVNGQQGCKFMSGLNLATSCKQKYIYKKLLAIPANGTRSDPVLENFQIPSCCSCEIKKSNLESRIDVPDRAVRVPPVMPRRPAPETVNKRTAPAPSVIDKVIFPDSPPVNEPKDVCADTFCTETKDYPSEFVNRLLRKNRVQFRSHFEEIPFQDPLTFRQNDDEELCRLKEEIITPQKALNKNFQWMFVFQDTKTGEFVQKVRIETCLPSTNDDEREATCKHSESFPLGYRTTCTQKFIYKKLLAVPANDSSTEPVLEDFMIPSCCSCVVHHSPGTITRFNEPLEPKKLPAKP